MWAETLTAVITLFGSLAWIDKKHRQDMNQMEERWERVFEKLHMIDKDVDALKNKSTKKKAA